MRTEIFIQARMGSTRLPGKVLKKVMGRPLLSYQIERLKRCQESDHCIILTTIEKKDDAIVEFCQTEGIEYFRGAENDVLSRYANAAKERKADIIVRSTADCPLTDPIIVDSAIRSLKESYGKLDYVSNTLKRSWPRGLDIEVFTKKSLLLAQESATSNYDREHVTPYIYHHPEKFRLNNIAIDEDLSQYNLTVDTQEDFVLINAILEKLYPENPLFTTKDIVSFLNQN